LLEASAAWREISARVFNPVCIRLARTPPRVADRDLIHDSVTTALERYGRRPERYDPARSSLPAYLTWVAHGCLLHSLRGRHRRHRRESVYAAYHSPAVENYHQLHPVEADELRAMIVALLETLHWRDRFFMMLWLQGGCSDQTMAFITCEHEARTAAEQKTANRRTYARILRELHRQARARSVSWNGPLPFVGLKYFARLRPGEDMYPWPETLEPGGVISCRCPTFRWSPVYRQSAYQLWLFDNMTGAETSFAGIHATSFRLSKRQALEPGHTYSWKVAPERDGHSSPAQTFRVSTAVDHFG
jgi:DNA-directed RNA polymerase specialized sigma24 family protein